MADLETLSIEELYEWVNGRYNEYTEGQIAEEVYLKDLEYYKQRLASSQELPTEEIKVKNEPSKTTKKSTRVRSTSIAGLRKKLMDELKK
ncbi:MAG: hypothetical protein ACXAD7_15885 [Candidatus Kariarchaeaceae archaeon]|jgi:hypothetical protein